MLQSRLRDLEGDERLLIDIVKDPSAKGGVRYVDPSDGEDLGRYGAECTARMPAVQQLPFLSPTEGERNDGQAFQTFYDGLTFITDVVSSDTAKNRAAAAYDILKAAIAMDLASKRQWGYEWHKIREAPSIRRALLDYSTGAARDTGWSCMTRLPSEGPVQVFEVRSSHHFRCLPQTWQRSSLDFSATGQNNSAFPCSGQYLPSNILGRQSGPSPLSPVAWSGE